MANQEGLDLQELRDLLTLLVEKRVSGFSGCGIAVSFMDEAPYSGTGAVSAVKTVDDGHSTSTKRVGGFEREGFAHPSLWPSQSGKVLTFKGELD